MRALQLLLLFSFLTSRMTALLSLSFRRDYRVPYIPFKTHTPAVLSASDDDNHEGQQHFSNGSNLPENRNQRRRKKLRSWLLRGLTATALFFKSIAGSPTMVQAKYSYELSETPTYSIRPGMSAELAQKLIQGEATLDELVPSKPGATVSSPAPPSSKISGADSLYGDLSDEDDDDFADVLAPPAPVFDRGLMGSRSNVPEAPRGRTQQFAAYHQEKNTALYVKVGACLFVPTFGGMFLREYIRRQLEEEYVKKGLAILEAQKAEYFNLTTTDTDDDTKGIDKKNGTDTDKDDDDDDDNDEDDDDDDDDSPLPPSSRGRPKRPSGGGGGGSGSGSDDKGRGGGGKEGGGGSSDNGYGRPSDEELDKLNQLFRKS